MKNDKQRQQPRSFIMPYYSTTVIRTYWFTQQFFSLLRHLKNICQNDPH